MCWRVGGAGACGHIVVPAAPPAVEEVGVGLVDSRVCCAMCSHVPCMCAAKESKGEEKAKGEARVKGDSKGERVRETPQKIEAFCTQNAWKNPGWNTKKASNHNPPPPQHNAHAVKHAHKCSPPIM